MNLNDPSLLIGVSIISEMHQNFEEGNNDDRDHITNLSLVIKGISGYLETMKMPKAECRKILAELEKYGKKLWIDYCIEQNEYDESEQRKYEKIQTIFLSIMIIQNNRF